MTPGHSHFTKVPMNIDNQKSALAGIESKIIATTGDDIDRSDCWKYNYRQRKQVTHLMEARRHILNDMFQPTEENMQRFQAVNARLYSLTQQLFRRIRSVEEKRPMVMDCSDFDDDYEIEGTLRYAFNSEKSVLKLNDDESYGSNFTLMIKLIADLSFDTVKENIEMISHRSIPLDDGQSWNGYPFIGHQEFDGIIICHAVHQLTDHQLYSIPDLIRLNDFWAEVKLTVQSITEQDGTRYIPDPKI